MYFNSFSLWQNSSITQDYTLQFHLAIKSVVFDPCYSPMVTDFIDSMCNPTNSLAPHRNDYFFKSPHYSWSNWRYFSMHLISRCLDSPHLYYIWTTFAQMTWYYCCLEPASSRAYGFANLVELRPCWSLSGFRKPVSISVVS